MKVYLALYNECLPESGYVTLSVHLSRSGAEKAIEIHKVQQLEEWKKVYPNKEDEPFEVGSLQDWTIAETEILP